MPPSFRHRYPETIAEQIRSARVRWQGCDWPTKFGDDGLDLNGIRSRQSNLAAKATRGKEAIQWAAATAWLAEVEADAARAAELAQQSLDEAMRSCWDSANDLIHQAELLESKYEKSNDYQQIRQALKGWRESETLSAEL